MAHAERQLEQSEQCLLPSEKIPQKKHVLSICEPHTRWIWNGKAGWPVEVGVPVCGIEDQFRFLPHHQVLWEDSDMDSALPFLEETQELFPDLRACSLDRNFHSPENHFRLDQWLDLNALPGQGQWSAQSEREAEEQFRQAHQQYPAVAAALHSLDQHGLDRVRERGKAGFERTVALAVLGAIYTAWGGCCQRTTKQPSAASRPEAVPDHPGRGNCVGSARADLGPSEAVQTRP